MRFRAHIIFPARCLGLVFFITCLQYGAYAQVAEDSISFSPLEELHSHDTSLFPLNEPVAIPGPDIDSVLGNIEYDPTVYSKKSDYWRKEFLKMISVSNGNDDAQAVLDSLRSQLAARYDGCSGKIIRNIEIRQLEIFGQNVQDTTQTPDRWIERLGNELHINTQKQVLKNRLLVSPGDIVDPLVIADNERLIRNMSFIEDALILLDPCGEDSVDMLVVTKDVLPIGFSWEIFDVAYGRTGLWNSNLLGLGHEFRYYLSYDFNRTPNYGHRISYRIQSIGNTFISAEGIYQNLWHIESYELKLNRDFITPTSKYAGGLGLAKVNMTRDIILRDSILTNTRIGYNYQDFWMGRAILLKRATLSEMRTNVAVTMRLMRYLFLNRPEVSEDFLYQFHSRTSLLGSVGISNQGFMKSRLIYGFGKSEDIPFGWLLTLTGGMEINEFKNRPYVGLSYSWARGNLGIGYLMQKIEYGTFINNGPEQGKLNYQLKYISLLLNQEGRFNYRVFGELAFEAGLNRYSYEFLELNESMGTPGLEGTELRGDQLVRFNLESVCYSPHRPLGFRFVYFLFVDAGMVHYKVQSFLDSPVYAGFGAGLRFKNENLVFSTVQLRLGYYPVLPEDTNVDYIQLSGIGDPRFERFTIPKPKIVEYKPGG